MVDFVNGKIYLELSDEAKHAHKFYEITIDVNQNIIRFGRIGDKG